MKTRTLYIANQQDLPSLTGLLNDKQISYLAKNESMIYPFNEDKVRYNYEEKVVSYGLNSYGYDMTLSPDFAHYISMDPLDVKNLASLKATKYTVSGNYLDLPPKTAVLARTNEYVKMPESVTGVVLGKSTYSRCGLLVNTTPLEAGWEGEITLELYNTENRPIRLYINEGIAQVLFFAGSRPQSTYNGSYQGQRGVTLPMSNLSS